MGKVSHPGSGVWGRVGVSHPGSGVWGGWESVTQGQACGEDGSQSSRVRRVGRVGVSHPGSGVWGGWESVIQGQACGEGGSQSPWAGQDERWGQGGLGFKTPACAASLTCPALHAPRPAPHTHLPCMCPAPPCPVHTCHPDVAYDHVQHPGHQAHGHQAGVVDKGSTDGEHPLWAQG